MVEALYVFEIPMSLPIDARVPDERVKEAKRVLARAKEVGEEYEGVEVATAMVRGRTAARRSSPRRAGAASRRSCSPPRSPAGVRGGAILGGRGRSRDRFVGETTRYVVEKAPCKVILTAPPAGEEGTREGVSSPRRRRRCGMFVLIVGCGRVGSAIANSMLAEGHEVSVLDEDAEAIALLERGQAEGWEERGGRFTEGTALEIDALLAAGIEQADAFVASTDGDNTNLVIAQIAKRRFEVDRVVVRVLDPARAPLVRRAGPADRLPDADRHRAARGRRARADPLRGGVRLAMYVVIVGAGKVGWNLARELIAKRHEVTVIESDPARFAWSSRSSSTAPSTATAPSCGCSSAPASSAPTWSWP